MASEEYWKRFTVTDPERPDLGGNCRHGDTASITPGLWRYLIDRFSPRSLLDIGCGEGHAMAFFRKQGVVAHGIDGLAQQGNAVHPFAVHDLTKHAYIYPCDIVLCVEVVEHIEEEFLPNLMATLTNAPIVIMTHAVPGQMGHHHVNLQPEAYWVERFSEYGYVLAPENGLFREMAMAETSDAYFGKTGLVFIKP